MKSSGELWSIGIFHKLVVRFKVTEVEPVRYISIVLFGLMFMWKNSSCASKTLYIDSVLGNDDNDGLNPSVGNDKNGPWKTFEPLRAHALAPGDTIRLLCGRTWDESLVVNASGTPTLPIVIESWPTNCSGKPEINGEHKIPASSWYRQVDGTWLSRWPWNLIDNGTFDDDQSISWSGWSESRTFTISRSTNCLGDHGACLRFTDNGDASQNIAISNRFPLRGGAPVSVQFNMKLATGRLIRAVVREHTAPFKELGFSESIIGTGAWESYSYTFSPNQTSADARLDFEIPTGSTASFKLDDIVVSATSGTPNTVLLGGIRQVQAHYPDGGSLIDDVTKYVATGSNAPTFVYQGRTVTQRIPSSLQFPKSSLIGSGIRVRSRAWYLENDRIADAGNGYLVLSNPTRYDVFSGSGYLLYGMPWMVSQPGEWATTQQEPISLTLIPSDERPPYGRVSVSTLQTGIIAQNVSYVRISNIRTKNVANGIDLSGSTNVEIAGVAVSSTSGNGIRFLRTDSISVSDSVLTDIGTDAMAGTAHGQISAQNAIIRRNVIVGSGVPANESSIPYLSSPAYAAVHAGEHAIVEDNVVFRSAYNAIRADQDSLVSGNHIVDACLVLDDGAGVYVRGTNNGSTVSNNIIENVLGNLDGSSKQVTHGVGIYLDDLSSNVIVRGNAILNSNHGIQVHNAFNNTIDANTLFANSVHQLWMQEDTSVVTLTGDLHDNVVTNNIFAPAGPEESVYQSSIVGHPRLFADYQQNTYSSLFSDNVATEFWINSSDEWTTKSFSLQQWKNAKYGGTPRGLDQYSKTVELSDFANYRIAGTSIVPLQSSAASDQRWTTWNSTNSDSTLQLAPCGNDDCVRILSGSSDSLLISPYFDVIESTWYRISFDVRSDGPTPEIEFLIRRGGGTTEDLQFRSLMGSKISLIPSNNWTRYVFEVKATGTAVAFQNGDPTSGARIDFGFLPPGSNLEVRSLEIVPITAIDGSTQIAMLVNAEKFGQYVQCPDVESNSTACDSYVTFEDQLPVIWPFYMAPASTKLIFTRDAALVDADGDGIPDAQDFCPSTPPQSGTNSRGCSIADTSF